MAVMAVLFDEDIHDKKILNGKSMIISLLHDMGECIIGDITPEQAEALGKLISRKKVHKNKYINNTAVCLLFSRPN